MLPDLCLDRDWAIGEVTFALICELLAQRPDGPIVEFGAGASSVRLAMSFPETQIISIEHDLAHYRRVRFLAERASAMDNLRLLLLPIEYGWYGPSRILSYRRHRFHTPVGAVIVDGPPHYIARGREACLYQVYDRLALNGLVLLHDYERQGEQVTVRNWLQSYPSSFDVTTSNLEPSLAVLRKTRQRRFRWMAPAKCRDNLAVNRIYFRQGRKDKDWYTHYPALSDELP